MSVNLEGDSFESTTLPELSTLKDINRLVEKMLFIETAIDEQMKQLQSLRAQHTEISEKLIPTVMDEAGMKEFKLLDGKKVTIKPFYSASIAKDRAEEAYNWLRENGHGDLIKTGVNVTFGKNEDEKAQKLVEYIKEVYEREVEAKPSVHPSTLSAFVKEQVTSGKVLPTDLLGVYVGRKTVVK